MGGILVSLVCVDMPVGEASTLPHIIYFPPAVHQTAQSRSTNSGMETSEAALVTVVKCMVIFKVTGDFSAGVNLIGQPVCCVLWCM